MRAILMTQYGGPEVLKIADIQIKQPGNKQALIRVKMAGVNFILIHEFRKIKASDTVLIHAAAGGMGLLLVQWANHLGARVLATTSTEAKAKIAKEAGADEVILYSKEDFAKEAKHLTNDRGVDLIIDGVGKTTFAGNLEAAARRGNIVIFGAASGPADPILPNSLMNLSLTVSGDL